MSTPKTKEAGKVTALLKEIKVLGLLIQIQAERLRAKGA